MTVAACGTRDDHPFGALVSPIVENSWHSIDLFFCLVVEIISLRYIILYNIVAKALRKHIKLLYLSTFFAGCKSEPCNFVYFQDKIGSM